MVIIDAFINIVSCDLLEHVEFSWFFFITLLSEIHRFVVDE